MSLTEFRERMDARAKFYRDELIPASKLSMDKDSGEIATEKDGEAKKYPMTPHGLRTFCQKLRIPCQYAVRCPPWLRSTNFNHWLKQKGEKELFVRFDSYPDNLDRIRAVLSKIYADLPNTTLARILEEKANKDYHFTMRYEDTPSLLIGQLVASNPDFVKDDDCGGIHVRNSEIGLAKVTLESLIYNRAEKSGVIMKQWASFSEKHIGDKEEFEKNFVAAVVEIMNNISGAIKNLHDLKKVGVEDVPDIVDVILTHNQVKEQQKVAVQRAMTSIEAKTLFDVVTIMIRAATDADLSLDDREELQRVGGQIVTNAKRYQRWL